MGTWWRKRKNPANKAMIEAARKKESHGHKRRDME